MRRFERTRAGKTQFWEAHAQDRFVCIAWGEVGGAKKQLDRNCGTAAAATAKLAELIEKQRADGYLEVSADVALPDPQEIARTLAVESPPPVDHEPVPESPARTFASSPELEVQCQLSPDDVAPWEIYSDWLIANGDIRGEIAALLRNHKERDATRLIAKDWDALFGTHAADLRDIAKDLQWRHGFLRSAILEIKDPDASEIRLETYVRSFLAAPIARFVTQLRFGLAGASSNNWGPTLRAVADSPQAPFVTDLRFDVERRWEISWTALGDLDGWSAFPRLRALRLRAGDGGTLGTLDLPALESFEYESCGISEREIRAIASASWPKLERLQLWLGAHERGAISSLAPLEPILAATGLPALRHLALCNTELIDDLIPALAESKVLPRLRTLDLSKSTLVSATALVDAATAFRHLRTIALERNLLSDDECDRIRDALPNARLDDQRYEEDDDDEPPRYVALWE